MSFQRRLLLVLFAVSALFWVSQSRVLARSPPMPCNGFPIATYLSIPLAVVPSSIALVGNIVALSRQNRSESWGGAGLVIGTLGLGLQTLAWATEPNVGCGISYMNAPFLALHVATVTLSIFTLFRRPKKPPAPRIYAKPRTSAKTLFVPPQMPHAPLGTSVYTCAQAKQRYRAKLSERLVAQDRYALHFDLDVMESRFSKCFATKAGKVMRQHRKKLLGVPKSNVKLCHRLYRYYKSKLDGGLLVEDKRALALLLQVLEARFGKCFLTKPGKALLQGRAKLLGSSQGTSP